MNKDALTFRIIIVNSVIIVDTLVLLPLLSEIDINI